MLIPGGISTVRILADRCRLMLDWCEKLGYDTYVSWMIPETPSFYKSLWLVTMWFIKQRAYLWFTEYAFCFCDLQGEKITYAWLHGELALWCNSTFPNKVRFHYKICFPNFLFLEQNPKLLTWWHKWLGLCVLFLCCKLSA